MAIFGEDWNLTRAVQSITNSTDRVNGGLCVEEISHNVQSQTDYPMEQNVHDEYSHYARHVKGFGAGAICRRMVVGQQEKAHILCTDERERMP